MNGDDKEMRISTAQCKFCGEKLAGTDPQQAYHTWKVHPEKVRECFDKGWDDGSIPDIIKIFLGGRENGYNHFLRRMKEIDVDEESMI